MKRKDFSTAIKNKWFEQYIAPLLTKKPEGQTNLEILYDLGERAFRYGVAKKQIEAVKEYVRICEKIYSDPAARDALSDVITAVLSDVEFEATSRLNDAIAASDAEHNEVRADLMMYTALVENFARPFLTPIHYYIHKYHLGQKGGAQTPEAYVYVSVAEKQKQISTASTKVTDFNLASLIEGLDIRIRHGGTGHEHWTILDDGKVEIKLVSASTGVVTERFILTKKELASKLEELEKFIWVIRAGLYVFLSNSDLKLKPTKPRTKAGVEKFSQTFAKGRVIDLATPFSWNEATKEISMKLSYTKPQKGTTVEFYTPRGAFEIIYYEFEEIYKYHILDVLKYIGLFVDHDKYKYIKVVAEKDGEIVLDAKYDIEDLIKRIDEGRRPPVPVEGKDISEEVKVSWIGEVHVPSGMKEIMEVEFRLMKPHYKIL